MTQTPQFDAPIYPPIPAIAVPLLSLAAFGSGVTLRTTDPLLPMLTSEFDIALLLLNRRLPAHVLATRKVEGRVVPRMIVEFREILAMRWARLVLLSVFLEGAFLYAAFAFIASHMYRTFGMSLSSAGAMITLYGLGGLYLFILLLLG